jgi:hypothetical protein
VRPGTLREAGVAAAFAAFLAGGGWIMYGPGREWDGGVLYATLVAYAFTWVAILAAVSRTRRASRKWRRSR